ncbi:hypothetical protein RhiirC2_815912 [Rhizophagus irregularis]|uniref:Uncharacterized protein n=1 Tax=Rhizophagus irregularis TaxID=588596 RepID=A0A2N1NQ35_9GLOM|nr:hypothetical protein RhiirC2_815912 [Rhizophagus irregularis]
MTIRAQSAIQPILFRQTTQSTGFGFGQTRSGFGNGFGMGQTTQPTGFGFGQTTQPTGFGFGQATQPTGGFGFGQATQPTGGFGFGQATQPIGGFGFGQATQPTGFGFGQTATQTSQPSLFGQTAAQTSQPSLLGQPTNSQTGFGFDSTHRPKFAFGSFAQSPSPIINNSNINHKESQIENLFEFLRLQSFNGKFLPNRSFYEFFYKDDLSDFNNLKQEIEKELSELSEKEIEEILSNCIAIAYLKIIMFDNFKDECEMCYEKVEKVLKKMIGNIEKERIIIERGEEWIKNWRK